jgi:hypothetical protein
MPPSEEKIYAITKGNRIISVSVADLMNPAAAIKPSSEAALKTAGEEAAGTTGGTGAAAATGGRHSIAQPHGGSAAGQDLRSRYHAADLTLGA